VILLFVRGVRGGSGLYLGTARAKCSLNGNGASAADRDDYECAGCAQRRHGVPGACEEKIAQIGMKRLWLAERITSGQGGGGPYLHTARKM
jgi:hypothetical protein